MAEKEKRPKDFPLIRSKDSTVENQVFLALRKKLKFSEASMLRTMVAAGELPPLKERLPEDPLVIKPAEEIGQYGGTLRLLNTGAIGAGMGMDFGGFLEPTVAKYSIVNNALRNVSSPHCAELISEIPTQFFLKR